MFALFLGPMDAMSVVRRATVGGKKRVAVRLEMGVEGRKTKTGKSVAAGGAQ